MFNKMKEDKEKLKNIKDLEYNSLLNKQNIFLVISATAVISVILSNNFPENLNKWNLVLTFILAIILSLLYYSKKLESKINDIKNL